MKTPKLVVTNIFFLTRVLLPLIMGVGVYVLLRKHSVFFMRNDLLYYLPNVKIIQFIKYNLPDGLWLYSFTNLQMFIWDKRITKQNLIWILIVPFIAISSEILQLMGYISGTYDVLDIITYAVALFTALNSCTFNIFTFKSKLLWLRKTISNI